METGSHDREPGDHRALAQIGVRALLACHFPGSARLVEEGFRRKFAI
jgi:hypothetical protein